MRVLVTGSRRWNNGVVLALALQAVYAKLGDGERLTVVHGGASGADFMADGWADRKPYADAEMHSADWSAPCTERCHHGDRRIRVNGKSYCQAAGLYRNEQMVDSGIDLVLAFFQPGEANTGTSRCVEYAHRQQVPVRAYGAVPQWVRQFANVP